MPVDGSAVERYFSMPAPASRDQVDYCTSCRRDERLNASVVSS